MLPPSAVTLLNNHDRSREQTVITGYATDPPEAAISIPSYQQRLPVNHQLFSRRVADYYRRGYSG